MFCPTKGWRWRAVSTCVVLALVACGREGVGGQQPSGEGGGAGQRANQPPIQDESQAGETPPEEDVLAKTVRIYTAWPLQGPLLPVGESLHHAAALALDRFGGGPDGYEAELVFNNDASLSDGAWDSSLEAEIAQHCVEDETCVAFIGPYTYGGARVSSPITNEAGIAQIAVGDGYPGLTFTCDACDPSEPGIYRPEGEQTLFRLNAPGNVEAAAGAAWAGCMGIEKVFVLDDGRAYGQDMADAFEAAAREAGLEVAGRASLPASEAEVKALMEQIRQSGATLVYGGLALDSGGTGAIAQMAQAGLFQAGAQFMGPGSLAYDGLAAQVGSADSVGDGNVLLTFPGAASEQIRDGGEEDTAFYEGYVETYGVPPSAWASLAYEATRAVLDAIERAAREDSGVTRATVLAAMRQTDFEGLAGRVRFDENGDRVEPALAGLEVRGDAVSFVEAISPGMACD